MGFLSTRLFLKNPPVFTCTSTDLLENNNLTASCSVLTELSSPCWKNTQYWRNVHSEVFQNHGLEIVFSLAAKLFSPGWIIPEIDKNRLYCTCPYGTAPFCHSLTQRVPGSIVYETLLVIVKTKWDPEVRAFQKGSMSGEHQILHRKASIRFWQLSYEVCHGHVLIHMGGTLSRD